LIEAWEGMVLRFWGTRRRFRLALRAALVTVGLIAGYTITLAVEFKHYGFSTLAFAVLLAATLLEFVWGDSIAERSYPYETERKLALLEDKLGAKVIEAAREKLTRTIASFRACDQSKISGTLHVIVDLQPSAESSVRYGLLQLTDYVGSYGGRKGRITTLEKGIIGRSARTGRRECVNFGSAEEYRSRMVEEFGFSARDANSHTTIARSYLAEPLLQEGQPIGVLYFFSTEPQTFPISARDSDLPAVAEDLVGLLRAISMI
jgi:hypothetical protein